MAVRVPRPFHGWLVVGCAFLIALWGWGLGFYGLGVYLVSLRSAHGWSTAAISGAITIYYLVGAALIALLGRAMARFGPATTVRVGIGAMALAVASLAAIREPWQLYAAFIAMAVGRFGFTTGLLVAVGVMVSVLMPIVSVVLSRRPGAPDGDAEVATRPVADPPPPIRPWRTRAYWTISIPFAAGLAAQVGFITHQVAFLSPLVGTAGAGVGVSVLALAATAGRLVLGGGVDRIDARRAACGNFLLQAAGFALLLWRPSELALYAGCIVVGLGVGNMVSLPGLLVGREFPLAHFAGVVSLITATNQVTFAFAPALMGILRDATGGYEAALALCLALDVLAAVVVVMGRGSLGAGETSSNAG